MTTTRKRRIVRRILWISLAIVLLPAWYAASWMMISRLALDNYISNSTAEATRPVFKPLLRFCESDLPGAHALSDLWWSVNPPVMMPARPHGFIGFNAPLSPPQLPFNEMLRRSRQPPKGMRFQVDPTEENLPSE
ncbi:MAG: hypothetical protein U0992_02945 [Planctomycetaceae bacterium]